MNDSITPTRTGRPAGAWLAIVAVAALGVGLVAGPTLASATAPRYAALATNGATGTTPDHTITVSGSGKVSVIPDIATVQLGVLVERATAKAARTDAATAMTAVVAALKALGIADKDIATSLVSLNPSYDYPTNAAPTIRGYQLSNEVTVTVRDLSILSDVLDKGVAAGATSVDGVSFDVADRTTAESHARDAAITDARAKADSYAKGLGIAITGVASVTESVSTPIWYTQQVPSNAAGAPGAAVAPSPSTPVLPGSTDVTISVQVAFLIP